MTATKKEPPMKTEAEKKGSLKVWWIPQVPMKAFEVRVSSLAEAKLLLNTLANYDLFQFKHKVKPDYANAGGLSVFEYGEWSDWSDDEGNSIDEIEIGDCIKLDAKSTPPQ